MSISPPGSSAEQPVPGPDYSRALAESEARFRAAAEGLDTCFGIYRAFRNDDGQIIDFVAEYLNEAAIRNNGLPREQQIGRRLLEILPAHRDTDLFRDYCRVVETGEPLHREALWYRDQYGQVVLERAFDIRASKLGDGFSVHWADVTERIRNEAALADCEERYRRISELSGDYAFTFRVKQDGTARREWISDTFVQISGYTPEELDADGGAGWRRLFHPDDLERVTAFYHAVLAGRPEQVEARLLARDGSLKWVRSYGMPVRDPDTGRVLMMYGLGRDITQEREAQTALRRSEAVYRTIAQHFPNGALCLISPDLRYLAAEGEAIHTTGLADPGMVGRTIREVLPADFADEVIPVVERIFQGETVEFDFHRFGRHWHNIGVPVRNEKDEIFAALTAGQDVTRRVEMEEALRDREERLRAALSASRTGTFRWNIVTNVLDWDENLDRLFGLAPGETARSLDAFIGMVHPADRGGVIERCKRCASEGADFDMAFRVIWPDGSLRWLLDRGKTFFDDAGRPSYMTGACVDITNRKHTEEALRTSEARFRITTEAMPQLVWITRADGYTEYFNQRWFDYTGTTPEQNLGWGWLDLVHPEDHARAEGAWRGAVETGEAYEVEYRLRTGDGSYRWVLARGLPVLDENGKASQWFGTCTDVDEQKRLLEEVRHADRAKMEFLAMLAHELRNPLAPIVNAVQLLEERPEAGARARDVISRQVRHMVRLVDDLLDISRLSRGNIELRLETVPAVELLHHAVEAARPLMDRAGHELVIHVPDTPVSLYADPARATQILTNLLNNAAKYTDPGGRVEASLSLGTTGGDGGLPAAVFRVRDNGRGLAPDDREAIFGMFHQVERDLARTQGGLGIGLTMVRRLAEMHGGTVRAYSDGPGRGSEFVVRLPLQPPVTGD